MKIGKVKNKFLLGVTASAVVVAGFATTASAETLTVKKENVQVFDNVAKVTTLDESVSVWSNPEHTKDAKEVAPITKFENSALQLVEKAETKEGNEKTEWYKFKLNGKDIGWVESDHVEVGKHDIVYVMQEGDTLELLLDTFDLDKEDVQKRNSDLDVSNLKEGDKVTLFLGEPLYDTTSFQKATPTASTQAFIHEILPVVEDLKEDGILPSVVIAQAIIESRSGNSGLAQQGNNLFGIKGTYNGNGVSFNTKEFYGGQYVTVKATFRAYPNWNASIVDHARLLKNNSRYSAVVGEKDYRKATAGLQRAGYATSPTYAQTLNSVIEGYGLYEYDN